MLRTTLAGLRAHARRLLATAVAVILGVGFVAGTLIFSDTAEAGYFDTFARVAKGVDVAVERPAPAERSDEPPPELTEAQAAAIRALPSVRAIDARVVTTLPMLDSRGRAITNFGQVGVAVSTDAEESLRAYDVQGRTPAAPGEALLDVETATHQRLGAGDSVTVLDPKGGRHTFRLVGLIDFGASQQYSGQSVVGLPAAEIRTLTGRTGYDEIVVAARAGVSQTELAAAVRAAVGPGPGVVTGDQRRIDLANSATEVASEFTFVLLTFGVISLVVAVFVIYNTFAILLAQRVRETALLRCVGATRRQVFGAVLLESLVVGLVGGVAGIALGVGVAYGLIGLLNGVLDAGVPVHSVVIGSTPVVAGIGVGVIVTVVAALLPAIRATRTSPLAALRDLPTSRVASARARAVRLVIAILVATGGIGLTWLGGTNDDPQTGTFVLVGGGVVTFLGVLICGPLYIGPLTAAVGAVPRRLFGVPVALAVANGRRNPGRTAVTSATLMIGVGLMSVFAVLIASMSETASRQIVGRYPVDYVMTSADPGPDGRGAGIPPGYAEALRARPEFSGVAETRIVDARVKGSHGWLAAISPDALGSFVNPEMTSGSLSALRLGTVVLSATGDNLKGIAVGQTVSVRVGSTTATLTVVGIGRLAVPAVQEADALVSWDQFTALAGAHDDATVMVKAAAGVTPLASRDALDALSDRYPLVQVGSLADLSNEISDAVNGLLALFGGLMGTAILIALFGIANTLSLSVVERTRESATVRALGLTRAQLGVTLLVEALMLGVVGAAVGITYGVIYGRLLVGTAFAAIGPTIVLPWTWIAGLVLIATFAAVSAAVLPARRAARASIVAAMADT